MPEQIQAIPTEYKGTVFKSKSEAIFARNLDLRGFTVWEYEPSRRFASSDGWCPDFWLVFKNRNRELMSALVEYKPSEPSDTYLSNLMERFYKMPPFVQSSCSLFVCCGSSFNTERKTLTLRGSQWKDIERYVNWFSHINEAARYRFDLKGGGY